ncbi:hypothetical protein Nepgr_006564 [Nepenthes gracilis]|uniref:Uncharacterized protein n=1 Tax=Nepenthes gracilis TaxID=150966 RepID=A0AAD3XHH0_NEPGR|nr:hypothetical protein Nepgr_006564 [Nepenthes gracilis]
MHVVGRGPIPRHHGPAAIVPSSLGSRLVYPSRLHAVPDGIFSFFKRPPLLSGCMGAPQKGSSNLSSSSPSPPSTSIRWLHIEVEAVQHHHRQQDNHSKYSKIPARPEKEEQEPTTTAILELQQFQHQLKAIRPVVEATNPTSITQDLSFTARTNTGVAGSCYNPRGRYCAATQTVSAYASNPQAAYCL